MKKRSNPDVASRHTESLFSGISACQTGRWFTNQKQKRAKAGFAPIKVKGGYQRSHIPVTLATLPKPRAS